MPMRDSIFAFTYRHSPPVNPWANAMIFLYFRRQNGEKIGDFDSEYCYIIQKLNIRNIGFKEKRHVFKQCHIQFDVPNP
jgi:hypothetical protein